MKRRNFIKRCIQSVVGILGLSYTSEALNEVPEVTENSYQQSITFEEWKSLYRHFYPNGQGPSISSCSNIESHLSHLDDCGCWKCQGLEMRARKVKEDNIKRKAKK